MADARWLQTTDSDQVKNAIIIMTNLKKLQNNKQITIYDGSVCSWNVGRSSGSSSPIFCTTGGDARVPEYDSKK
jgi:hypothetical protein